MIGDKPSGNIVHNQVHEFMVIGDQREGERERERENEATFSKENEADQLFYSYHNGVCSRVS